MKIAVITYEAGGFFFGFDISFMIGNRTYMRSIERKIQVFELGKI